MPNISPVDLSDQFGFKPSGSTEAALVDLTHIISNLLDDNKCATYLLIDLSNAFDRVDHSKLITALE